MGKIEWGRVFIGGTLAGIAANIISFGSWYLFLQKVWSTAMAQLGRPIQETMGFNVFWFIWYLFLGITATWLYAAVRPRFGPGARTASIAGLSYWFFAYLLPNAGWVMMTRVSCSLLAQDAAVNLVAIMVATFIGGWWYQESPA